MRVIRSILSAALAVALCGCGDDDGSAGPDAGAGADADPAAPDADPNAPDAGGCVVPDPAPAWLTPYQQDIVGALTGHSEIAPGVTLDDRASTSARNHTRAYLQDTLGDLGLTAELHTYETGANVWARIPATTGSDETVVLGAHFDTVTGSPGANDNATGVAAVVATARYLTGLPCRSRDVIIVLFDQEEIGYVGSWHFASMLDSAGTEVISVHSVDQMGWDADGDRAIELERADPGLYELYAEAVATADLDIPLIQTGTGGTDHVAFREWGFAAIGITEEYVSGDTTPHYHLASDQYGTVNFPYLASTTELLAVVFARLLE
jgi:Zn-dependent M28 family amino/carboxypeptidase